MNERKICGYCKHPTYAHRKYTPLTSVTTYPPRYWCLHRGKTCHCNVLEDLYLRNILDEFGLFKSKKVAEPFQGGEL